MLPRVDLPIQRMGVHVREFPCRPGLNQGYQWAMTRPSNLSRVQVPLLNTLHCIRCSQSTSHTLLASELGGAPDL